MPNITGNIKFNIFYTFHFPAIELLPRSKRNNKSVAPFLMGTTLFSIIVYILIYSASDIKGYL